MHRYLALLVIIIVTTLTIVGCSESGEISNDLDNNALNAPNMMDNVALNLDASASSNFIKDNMSNENFVILDVRTPEENNQECLKNAVNIDYESPGFTDEVSKLDKSKSYMVYCRSGRRSGEAVSIMQKLGFGNIHNLVGGINSWKDSGEPIETSC